MVEIIGRRMSRVAGVVSVLLEHLGEREKNRELERVPVREDNSDAAKTMQEYLL